MFIFEHIISTINTHCFCNKVTARLLANDRILQFTNWLFVETQNGTRTNFSANDYNRKLVPRTARNGPNPDSDTVESTKT